MAQETTQPLYKVLNEERTQGTLMLYKKVLPNNHLSIGVTSTNDKGATHTILSAENYSSLDIDIKDEWTKKAEINAKYTALAVNNLANVADALQRMYDAALLMANYKQEIQFFDNLLNEAKEALKAIS